MIDVEVKFPYLDTPNPNNVQFDQETRGNLDTGFNYDKNYVGVPVTFYDSLSELKYALGSSLRYQQVDTMFRVGSCVGFSPENGTITLQIKDEFADKIKNGDILPRVIGKVYQKNDTTMMTLEGLVCIDVMEKEED